jgi:hypothetical protein
MRQPMIRLEQSHDFFMLAEPARADDCEPLWERFASFSLKPAIIAAFISAGDLAMMLLAG